MYRILGKSLLLIWSLRRNWVFKWARC